MSNERLKILLSNAIIMLEDKGELEMGWTECHEFELGITEEEYNEIMGNEEDY